MRAFRENENTMNGSGLNKRQKKNHENLQKKTHKTDEKN